nr:MAG TPA: hypothetical protein [Caudoviricetes sp.]
MKIKIKHYSPLSRSAAGSVSAGGLRPKTLIALLAVFAPTVTEAYHAKMSADNVPVAACPSTIRLHTTMPTSILNLLKLVLSVPALVNKSFRNPNILYHQFKVWAVDKCFLTNLAAAGRVVRHEVVGVCGRIVQTAPAAAPAYTHPKLFRRTSHSVGDGVEMPPVPRHLGRTVAVEVAPRYKVHGVAVAVRLFQVLAVHGLTRARSDQLLLTCGSTQPLVHSEVLRREFDGAFNHRNQLRVYALQTFQRPCS